MNDAPLNLEAYSALMMSRRKRRAALIADMEDLAATGIDCSHCLGLCCTAVANSMQLSPVEALDLYVGLKEEGRLDRALVLKLRETVLRYGLDRAPPGDGRRLFLRRHFTCPFYADGHNGCTLSRGVKPYGCLAFNPSVPQARGEAGQCRSDQRALAALVEPASPEARANESLAGELGWTKLPLPVALLAVMGRLSAELLA